MTIHLYTFGAKQDIMRTRDQAKYDAIVRSSIELVNKLGFDGISISKIAKQAKVSPATIYIYFENKEDLFTKLYINIRKEMSQGGLQGLQEDVTIEQAFKSIWHNSFSFYLSHPQYLAYREQFEQTTMMKNVKENEFELFQRITSLLQRGINDDKFRNLPLALLTSFAFVPIITLVRFHLGGVIKMNENLITNAYEIAWNAIAI
jgi:TetR/AcrR family transcriptional repressor of multidrug resistance operon